VKGANYEAPHYDSLLALPPSYIQIFSSAPCSQILDALEEIKVDLQEKKLAQYKQKCLNYISRLDDVDNQTTP
jgi:hypothetical protein